MEKEQNLLWLLMQVMFKNKHAMQQHAEKYDLTFVQVTALKVLDKPEPQPMKTLSDYLMCDASTITGLVDRLEGRGLISRQNHPSDRRIKLIALTEQGRKLQAEIMHNTLTTESAKIEKLLTPDEVSQLRDMLTRILRAV